MAASWCVASDLTNWLLFDEVGRIIGSRYRLVEAIAGVVSEARYLPLSTRLIQRLLDVQWKQTAVCLARKGTLRP
jgi:hypothetical protein